MLRTIEISGTAAVPSVVQFVERLDDLGYPNTVLEVSLARVKPSQRRFDLRMELGLFHLAPKPAPAATGPGEMMPDEVVQ